MGSTYKAKTLQDLRYVYSGYTPGHTEYYYGTTIIIIQVPTYYTKTIDASRFALI